MSVGLVPVPSLEKYCTPSPLVLPTRKATGPLRDETPCVTSTSTVALLATLPREFSSDPRVGAEAHVTELSDHAGPVE